MAGFVPGFVIFVICILMTIVATDAGDWSYLTKHQKGPHAWGSYYSKCSGELQSPININTQELKYDQKLKAIHMDGYDRTPGGEWTLSNNGYHVTVTVPSGITIDGAGLDGTFEAAQFHFHWGSFNDHGSEHTVDGHKYPIELHIVHYNTKYGSLESAMDKSKGLAVLGVFIEIGDFNPGFEAVTSKLPQIHHLGASVRMTAMNLRMLLPRGLHNYYRYDGSLTTPPCYESVQWTVFEETVKISQEQMDAFRAVQYDSDPQHPDPMVDNFRETQPIGKRVIYTSEAEDDPSGGNEDFNDNWILIGCIAAAFFVLGRVSANMKSSILKVD